MRVIPNQSYKEGVETMNLNRNEVKSAIIGMVMGDASIGKRHKNGNAGIQMTHCERQFCYMIWKKSILDNITRSTINFTKRVLNGKTFYGYHLGSYRHPVFTSLYKRFYYGKIKVVDEYLVKMITPLALAILFMDDGTVGSCGNRDDSYFLCIQNFDYANQLLIKKSLKINFGLDWNINKCGLTKSRDRMLYRLRLANRHNQQFVDIVKPYLEQVPCMLYKLGSYANISNNLDIDIVRSS